MSAVGGVDHELVQRQIADEAGWSGRYAFLIIISAAISLLGLLMPSVAVLIGAMLLSPLMMPIIGLGFGIATFDFASIRRSAFALIAGAVVAVTLSVVLVSISPIQTVTSEIAGRTQPTLFDLLVALLSAIAGGYALIRQKGGTVVGVAIAIALMPPLVVVGFGIATLNWTIFSGSLLLFTTNAVTIALTAAMVARVYGFGSHLSPSHTGWQLALFVAALGALCVPLGASLKRIAFEAVAQRQVRDTLRASFPSAARISQLEIDQTRRPMRIRVVMLTPSFDAAADAALAQALGRRLGQRVDIHVDQVRISTEDGAGEAAQIASATADNKPTAGVSEAASATLAAIAGVPRASVLVDAQTHRLSATSAPLSGVALEGYLALERRAAKALPDWRVELAPPADIAPPAVSFEAGVVDGGALDAAAWASARLRRGLTVDGGSAAQRRAVVTGILSRGGTAVSGVARGALRISWSAEDEPPSKHA